MDAGVLTDCANCCEATHEMFHDVFNEDSDSLYDDMNDCLHTLHCAKSVRIWNFSGLYFPAFGLNTEKYSMSPPIQSKCGKIRTRKTLNTDIFHSVLNSNKNFHFL